MDKIVAFLLQYDYVLLFAAVLAEQLGAPIPAIPVLLAAGALTASGHISFAAGMVVALAASLLSDGVWYGLGKRKGPIILRTLCKIALEPDSCVSITKAWFKKLGGWSLVVAKFIPGLSTAAPPIAGATGMRLGAFLLLDGLGALVWAGVWMLGGLIFSHQLERAAEWATEFGLRAAVVLCAGLGGYILFKYVQRKRFLQTLRLARISPNELRRLLEDSPPPFIVDLRNPIELGAGSVRIPGAVWFNSSELAQRKDEIPRDREIVLYCS
jgi:membrane protein DedA with SNARE-associated domain